MNVFIAGLGLIGGSFAKAFKRHTNHTIYGYDINPATAQFALSRGAIDIIADESDLKNCGFVVVCLYPKATVDFINRNAANFKKGSVITDACGVKGVIYDGIENSVKGYSLRFVGAHPMAGREQCGFDYSEDELYAGASLIVTPEGADDEAVTLVCEIALQLGFGECKITDKATHDIMIAYTSQLPHVLACSYINDPLAPLHFGYSAGSFKDVSRVARINAEMWSELFLDNKEALSQEIAALISNLSDFKDLIDKNDRASLKKALEKSRKIKEQL